MKVKNLFAAALCASIAGSGFAAVDLSFEAADTNLLNGPGFSGSTIGIEAGSSGAPSATQSNDQLSPGDGTQGTQSQEIVFQWSTDDPATSFIRMTDFSDRHLLSDPADTGGVGLYYLYDGAAGDMEINIGLREDPTSSGDNEVYENMVWKTISGGPNWQYLYWDFATETDSNASTSWAISIALGDGVYDGGDVGDAAAYEGVFLRPILGTTATLTNVNLFLDDIHSGTQHTPLNSTVGEWEMY